MRTDRVRSLRTFLGGGLKETPTDADERLLRGGSLRLDSENDRDLGIARRERETQRMSGETDRIELEDDELRDLDGPCQKAH